MNLLFHILNDFKIAIIRHINLSSPQRACHQFSKPPATIVGRLSCMSSRSPKTRPLKCHRAYMGIIAGYMGIYCHIYIHMAMIHGYILPYLYLNFGGGEKVLHTNPDMGLQAFLLAKPSYCIYLCIQYILYTYMYTIHIVYIYVYNRPKSPSFNTLCPL